MTWTQEDYENLKKAYLALMAGKRVVETDLGAGRQRVFQRGDVGEMRNLLNEMEAQLGIFSEKPLQLRTYARQGGRG